MVVAKQENLSCVDGAAKAAVSVLLVFEPIYMYTYSHSISGRNYPVRMVCSQCHRVLNSLARG